MIGRKKRVRPVMKCNRKAPTLRHHSDRTRLATLIELDSADKKGAGAFTRTTAKRQASSLCSYGQSLLLLVPSPTLIPVSPCRQCLSAIVQPLINNSIVGRPMDFGECRTRQPTARPIPRNLLLIGGSCYNRSLL